MTANVLLVLAVGVGRGDPPSETATPTSPRLSLSPLPSLPPIPADQVAWKKTERIDTPAPADKAPKADPQKLKEEVDKLLKEQPAKEKPETASERDKLRGKLDELLEKLEQQKKSPKPPPAKPHDTHDAKPSTPKVTLPEGGKPIDLVRSAGNLYKAGDHESAYELLKVLDTTQMPKEDRAFADYVRAACLRKLGRTTDAIKLYRAIADAKDDPFLAESAVVQLTAINSARDLEAQLEQLKSRRKTK